MARILGVLLAVICLCACGARLAEPENAPPHGTSLGQTSGSEEGGSGGGEDAPSAPAEEEPDAAIEDEAAEPDQEEPVLKITAGNYELTAAFVDNSSADEFRDLLAQGPVTVEMEDYGGFEKVGPLGTTLTRNDTRITTEPGDIILYQGNQITIYYGTNSWSFTRLARIDDPTDLKAKLGDGTVQVTFSLA